MFFFSFFGGCSSTNIKKIADYGSHISVANSDLSTRYYIIEVSWFLYSQTIGLYRSLLSQYDVERSRTYSLYLG